MVQCPFFSISALPFAPCEQSRPEDTECVRVRPSVLDRVLLGNVIINIVYMYVVVVVFFFLIDVDPLPRANDD